MAVLDARELDELVAPYRRELQLHCYRILGSVQDAEEALQDTVVAVWRHHDRFEDRASVRTWLYRIATNQCLDRLRAQRRRPVSAPLRREPPPPSAMGEVPWLEPYPDSLLPDPVDVVQQREAISLAYIRMLQLLPPRQRIVLVLRDVLQFRASEVAEMLDVTEESVSSALKRARASLRSGTEESTAPAPSSAVERQVVDAWLDAFSRMDVPRMVDLLTEDAWLRMPPLPFEYRGRDAAERFFLAMTTGPRADRFVETRANGQPAYAEYREDATTGVWHCVGFYALTLAGSQIAEITRFEPAIASLAGLPRILPSTVGP